MQAFMAGKLVVDGDMMKLLALPMIAATDPAAQAASEEIRAITD
jgi:putative sterol carrier protein